MNKTEVRRSPHFKSVAEEVVTVRSVRQDDVDAVKQICYGHFRSLCFAAVNYYCLAHFRDLVALIIISKLFQPWKEVGLAALLFLAYLFARARIEMELYILFECPDLNDIFSYYMTDPRSHFWVAEGHLSTNTSKDVADSNKAISEVDSSITTLQKSSQCTTTAPLRKRVLGCVGCAPVRDDDTVVQLLRLVVAEDVRRMRHGSRLLAQFENFAREKGYKQVRLYTNNLSSNHMKFIRQHGYVALQTIPRSLMRGSLIEWKKKLSRDPSFSTFTMNASAPQSNETPNSNFIEETSPASVSNARSNSRSRHPTMYQRHAVSRITLLQD